MASRHWIGVARLEQLTDDEPLFASAMDIDLVVVKSEGQIHVLYGRCPHRGALMASGCLEGASLVCTAHGWDFALATGASTRVPGESLARFAVHVDAATGEVLVDQRELEAWRVDNPQSFHPGEFI
ncbi:MAG: Rieske (2Fe-2S) protein [Deltaproteobacteria bacterium]|nr:Rieske (2Fe-2S) protein [Deltaproteobacteria bacterium]